MAVTGKQVYDAALVLMDEVQENGSISPDNPNYYQNKAVFIINTLQFELTTPTQTPTMISTLNENVSVSDRNALLIMPYGLAAHLLLSEGDSSMSIASFFNNRYEELKRKLPTSIKPITDANNVLGGMV